MAADLGQNFGTQNTVAGLGATIAAGGTDDATEIDLTNGGNSPLALDVECIMPMLTGTPDLNKRIVVMFRWGSSTGNPNDPDNIVDTRSVSVPTASITYKATFRVAVQSPYLTIRVFNDQTSGPSLDSTYTIKYRFVHGNQV